MLCAADSRFIPERGNPLGRTKKPAVRQVFLLCAADSRFIPERGNPLGRTTKKPAVRQVFWAFKMQNCKIQQKNRSTYGILLIFALDFRCDFPIMICEHEHCSS